MVAIEALIRFTSNASGENINGISNQRNPKNVSLITDAIIAFAIASQNHRADFRRIFENIETLP